MKKIMIFGDIHFPFHHKKALSWALSALRAEKPDVVVQIGDLLDQYVFSRFTRSPSFITPKEEMERGLNEAGRFWKEVKSRCPRAGLYQVLGNHDMRLRKRIGETLPELESVFDSRSLYRFPGVHTMQDDRTELAIGDITIIHGHLSKLGDHMKKLSSKVVVGHSHTGGVVFSKHKNGLLWELNAGFLADEAQLPLNYGPTRMKEWTLGYGLVDNKGPRFVPYGCKK
jgi:predicted phosphodiesterase